MISELRYIDLLYTHVSDQPKKAATAASLVAISVSMFMYGRFCWYGRNKGIVAGIVIGDVSFVFVVGDVSSVIVIGDVSSGIMIGVIELPIVIIASGGVLLRTVNSNGTHLVIAQPPLAARTPLE